EGLYRGGPGRDRQCSRGGGGWVGHRHHRVLRRRQPLFELSRRHRLRDPDRYPSFPPVRTIRQKRGGESLVGARPLRDLIYAAIFVAVLIGASYGLDAIHITGIAYYQRILVLVGINIILAVSLNIISGHAGQFSLGHAGFMALGAYFASFLTFFYFMPYVNRFPEGTQQWVMQNALLLVAILLGGVVAAIAGYVVGLPSLRLRGDYLAIVTLGFGEIIRVLILNIEKIGAARGFSGIPKWSNFFWVYFFCGLTVLKIGR